MCIRDSHCGDRFIGGRRSWFLACAWIVTRAFVGVWSRAERNVDIRRFVDCDGSDGGLRRHRTGCPVGSQAQTSRHRGDSVAGQGTTAPLQSMFRSSGTFSGWLLGSPSHLQPDSRSRRCRRPFPFNQAHNCDCCCGGRSHGSNPCSSKMALSNRSPVGNRCGLHSSADRHCRVMAIRLKERATMQDLLPLLLVPCMLTGKYIGSVKVGTLYLWSGSRLTTIFLSCVGPAVANPGCHSGSFS